jgi:hypothetical protein
MTMTPEIREVLRCFPLTQAAQKLGVRYYRLRDLAVQEGIPIIHGRPTKTQEAEYLAARETTMVASPPQSE